MEREKETLTQLRQADNLRALGNYQCQGPYIYDLSAPGQKFYNLSSNDYLGLTDTALQKDFFDTLDTGHFLMSHPSSRLVTGNGPDYASLENLLAEKYEPLFDSTGKARPEALVLGSGYAVNSGVLPAVTRKGDLILADKLVHASLIDGLKLCEARWQRYRHNDMGHLRDLLQAGQKELPAGARLIVVTESIFSMDGDRAPLDELAQLQQQYGFLLYLDEAHAFAIDGHENSGLGAWDAYNRNPLTHLHLKVHYLVVTFGKALASAGAALITDSDTRELLVNRMRTLIYSTALPPIQLQWSRFLIERFDAFSERRQALRENIRQLQESLSTATPYPSQIIPIHGGDNATVLDMVRTFREYGYWTTAIRTPTVPPGTARVRVCLSAAHDPGKIKAFAAYASDLVKKRSER